MKIFYSALFLVLLHGIAHAQCGDFTLTVDNVQPPSCPNSSDGAITLSAAGAQGTVSYTWSEAGLNSPTIDGLAPGVYSVTATDDAGCEAVETVVLSAAVVADAGEDLSLSCGTDAVTLGGAVFSPVVFAEQGFQTIEFINASSEEVPFNGTPGGIFIGPVRDTAEYVANDNGVSVQFGNLSGQSGSQVYLPIYVGQGFDDMISFQFGISFDTTMLKLVGMVIPTNALPNFAVSPGDPQIWPQGFFLLSWNSPVPSIGHSLPDGHLLALLQFTVTGSSASTTGPDITYQWTGPNDFTSDEPFPQVARSGAYTLRVTDSSRPDCWAEDVVEVNLVNDIVADAGPDVGAECGAGPVTIGGVGNTEVYFSEDINSIAFVESGQGPIPSNVISGEVGSNPNSPGFDTGSGELFAVIGSATAGVGDTVRLPVRVYNFINISGAAFTSLPAGAGV
ncbi:MAG: SprB repeat-containing protein [Lewinellaceae bacterium]|nr:SprB repeat-containing protein [Lewinellaceae bacterium]